MASCFLPMAGGVDRAMAGDVAATTSLEGPGFSGIVLLDLGVGGGVVDPFGFGAFAGDADCNFISRSCCEPFASTT